MRKPKMHASDTLARRSSGVMAADAADVETEGEMEAEGWDTQDTMDKSKHEVCDSP
jgi:hypothetical protein